MNDWFPWDITEEPRAVTVKWTSDDGKPRRSSMVVSEQTELIRRQSVPQTIILYALDCGHVAIGKAFEHATLFCHWCKKRQTIKDVHVHEWHVKCLTCPLSKWHGLAPHEANITAQFHVRKNPAHIIRIEYAERPASVKVRERRIASGLVS